MIELTIDGKPPTQGSMPVIRGRLITPPALKAYRAVVAAACESTETATFTGPVSVTAVFTMTRPKSHYGTGRNASALKRTAPAEPTSLRCGDVDKLSRALLDALTYAGIWADDRQVIHLDATKEWGDADRTRVLIESCW